MNNSLKHNINEKVLMKIHCKNENEDVYHDFLKSKSPMDFLSGNQ